MDRERKNILERRIKEEKRQKIENNFQGDLIGVSLDNFRSSGRTLPAGSALTCGLCSHEVCERGTGSGALLFTDACELHAWPCFACLRSRGSSE